MTYCAECGRECQFPWFYADSKSSIHFVDIDVDLVDRVMVNSVSKQVYFCSKEHREYYFRELD